MAEDFYRRWIIANSWSEGVGLSITLGIAFLAGAWLEARTSAFAIVLGALVAVLLGTLLEGVLVGFAQGRVVHRFVAGISVLRWTVATAIGAGIAWLVGMVPSTAIALLQTGDPGFEAVEPQAWFQYGLALVLGMVVGPILAFPQMMVLRRFTPRAFIWLPANALAWAVGMPFLFFGMDQLPWGGSPVLLTAGVVVVCLAVGALVGAVHGVYLRRLIRVT